MPMTRATHWCELATPIGTLPPTTVPAPSLDATVGPQSSLPGTQGTR